MKKALSVLLSVLVVLSTFAPFAASATKASDAYAVIFTASDFQSTSCYNNLTAMMQSAQADGITETPDGFLFGGDYTANSEDPAVQVPKVTETVQAMYPDYDESKLVYVQGNHDGANSVLTPTGFYEFENYFVYSINEDDFKTGQYDRDGYDKTVQALAEKIEGVLRNLVRTGDKRPVFVTTHVPLHHSKRSSYGENLYSKYIFDVLNEYGKELDIIFLFGHNHSNTYDDYIGGAVNYIAKDEKIRIPIPDKAQQGINGYTEETLNFTYMNYGYVGYSNNSSTSPSTNTLTMGTIELCPDTIEVSRYSTKGLYTTETISRINPVSSDPDVAVKGNDSGLTGSSDVLFGTVDNINATSYSWSCSDDSVVDVLPAGKNAQVVFKKAGTVTITFSVTAEDGTVYTDTKTLEVTAGSSSAEPESSIVQNGSDVSNMKLKYYEATYGDSIMLEGIFSGFAANAEDVTVSWTSSDPSVATVENGLVTFVSSGETTISYAVSDGTDTLVKTVTVFISRSAKSSDVFKLTNTFEAGKSYVFANVNTAGSGYVMGALTFTVSNSTTYYNVRMPAVGTTITEIEGVPSIVTDDDSFVWNAVSDENGNIYLQNEKYGTYLCATQKDNWTHEELTTTYDISDSGTKWHLTEKGVIASDVGNGIHFSGDINFRAQSKNSISGQYLYEKVETAPYVTLKQGNEPVDGMIKTIYSVGSSTQIKLTGTNSNFGEDFVVQWISSDESVATVDENGVVSFKGIDGEVDITYLVSDSSGASDSATVTYQTKVTKEPVRYFKYTETIEPGKNYIVVSSNSVGAAYYMLSEHLNDKQLKKKYTVVQPDTSDNSVYIEIPVDESVAVWTPEASSTDGYYYLVNEADGSYLYATDTPKLSTSADKAAEGTTNNNYIWSYSGEGIYTNAPNSDTGVYAGIRHGTDYFRGTKAATSEKSNVYFFEETELIPYVHIRSKYVNVENTTLERTDICTWQTEELMAKPINFPNNDFVTFSWSSSNPAVATVDSNGVVTYTGAPGTTEITVIATSTLKDKNGNYPSATAKTTITVPENVILSADTFILTQKFIPGEFYVISASNVSGSSYAMDSTKSGSSNLKASAVSIQNSGQGVCIETNDSNIIWECLKSDTEGYIYLRNVANGEYLVLSRDSGNNRKVTTTPNLDEGFDHSAYLIKEETSGKLYSKLSTETNNVLQCRASDKVFRLSTASDACAYIYQRVDAEAVKSEVQIRVSDFFGSKDITNVLQNRYNIQSGDTEQLLSYTRNINTVTSTIWSVSDESIATVDSNGLLTYTGKSGFVTVALEVVGTDADGQTITQKVVTTLNVTSENYESPTEDYPQYPHEGSVRINKTASNFAGGHSFQTTGVTEVELSITGVPLPHSVDVVVVFDHSSSMNSGGRLKAAIEDTQEFALQVVNVNPKNRIAIVTFDRYKNNYESITDTTSDYSSSGDSTEDRIITGDGTPEGAFVTINESETLASQIDSLQYNKTAGTNYDYGLKECYNILKAAKNDPNANKNQYVVFMSDGEPYVFNNLRVEYDDSNEFAAAYEAWLRGDETSPYLTPYLENPETYPAVKYFNKDGDNWYSAAIKTPEGQNVAGIPDVDDYQDYKTGLGANVFTIGYGAGQPGTLTRDILTTMASTPDNFYYAEGNLQEAYDTILQKIIYAASNAVITDKMGDDFDLQFAPSIKLGNGMSELTLSPSPCIEFGSWTLNSDGTRNEYTVVEKITFETDANGNLTAAYSSLKGNTNIYDSSSNKIVGAHVTYDIANETFIWNEGDITREESTLKYYAYLEGAAEGTRAAGVYDTNEYAYVDYINYRGTQCHLEFPVPSLGWKDAMIGYEFYLVNKNGEPVNNQGIVVPFAERVLIAPEETKSLTLNTSSDYSAITLIAKNEIPDGYILFNPDTSYTLSVSSGDNPSRAEINDDHAIKTTYFRDGTILYKGHGEVPNVKDYMNTHVSFAILRIGDIAPDSVVIDYGLPVKISVLENDVFVINGKLNAISTTIADSTVLNSFPYVESRIINGVKTDLALANGSASIVGDKIVFTPSNLEMSTENKFYYEYLTDEGYYLYAEVTVIPAANIYYEESFFTFKDGNGYVWQTAGTSFTDKFQAEDRPGTTSSASIDANNSYGLDNAYDDSYTYSLGSAKYTSVDGKAFGKEPTAEFSFCGTGFDLFSVTNSNTGAVLVTVYNSSGATYKNYIVQTYYGYSYDAENDKYLPTPESEDCLYQVPVIRADNLNYGTYRVVIKPLYSTMFDMANDGSYDIYVDSVRIYNPAGQTPDADSVIGSAYLKDSEYNPSFTELRRTILDAKTFYSDAYILEGESYGKGSIFIDSIGSLDENGISDKYLEAGPNNEVYLAKGQAIAFHLKSDKMISPSNVELGMKTVFGGSSKVALMNSNEIRENYVTVSGAHEMFRGLSKLIVWDEAEIEATGIYKTKYPIVIVNTSDSILALTSLKWAYENAETDADLQVVVDPSVSTMAYAVTKSVMAEFPYTDEDISMEWSDTSLVEGKDVTLQITTPADIEIITIDGIEITDFELDENGNKIWSYTFTVVEVGENTYDILLYANTGKVSQPMITETITVKEYSIWAVLLDAILDFLKRVILFFRRVFI